VRRTTRKKPASDRLFHTWSGRAPDFDATLPDVDTRRMVYLGDALRVDYASDKWGKRVHEYTHDFKNRPLLLGTEDGTAILIVSHPRRRIITARGIVG